MNKVLVSESVQKRLQRYANSVARKNGHGKATTYILGTEDRVVSHVRYGYRKKTTGEYVPGTYRSNFGWKNTYYQPAITEVEINTKRAMEIQR